MKKYLVTILVLFSMLLTQVGIAAAAPSADGTATLVSVEHGLKGPVFTFSVSGKFSKTELKGFLQVQGGDDYSLYCTQVDESTVKCTTSDKVSGVNVVLSWGGGTFWAFVPEAPPAAYCYNVYDYDRTITWKIYGTYCQDYRAEYGDTIPWYNPDWDDYFDAVFLPEHICAGIVEDAYYYPFC